MQAHTVAAAALIERPYHLDTHGLVIDRALTSEEWCAVGDRIAAIASGTNWAIGDWLVYAAGRGDFGEFYMEARRITGRSFESLSQYARVSQTFPLSSRAVRVPWSFYREALRLPEPDRLRSLDLAYRNSWTRDGLAEFISTRDGAAPSVAKALTEREVSARRPLANGWHQKQTSHHSLTQCPSCGFKFERKRRTRAVLSLVETG
jgi:hypothetical protein